MNFDIKNIVKEEELSEAYHNVEGKYVKDESKYYHYTNIDRFPKIVNDLINGKGLRGGSFAGNLTDMGRVKKYNSGLPPRELCLVRSDRIPDYNKEQDMSGNVGDIKFTFKEDKVQNKFGKIKPIEERVVLCKRNVDREFALLRELTNDAVKQKKIDILRNRWTIKSEEEIRKSLNSIGVIDKMVNNIISYIDIYRKTLKADPEKMESRIITKDNPVSLNLINTIYIPDYLKSDVETRKCLVKLRGVGFNNIKFYNCKHPKDPDYYKYSRDV